MPSIAVLCWNPLPMRLGTAALLFLLATLPATAQFGNEVLAFDTDHKYPTGAILHDMDGDGDLDALFKDTDHVYWHMNNGSGAFGPAVTLTTEFSLYFGMHDLDGDGDADLVCGSDVWPGYGNLGWYRNDGGGVYVPMNLILSSVSVNSGFRIADMDDDGDLDFVLRTSGYMHVHANDGAGNFAMGANMGIFDTSGDIVSYAADADGDLDTDLLVFGQGDQRGYYQNLGAGTFAAPTPIAGASIGTATMLWDRDGDNDPDVLMGNAPTRWLLNDGSGLFAVVDTIMSIGLVGHAADADNDGDAEIFYGSTLNLNPLEYRNDDTTFVQLQIENVQGYSLQGVSFDDGDVDGDGLTDLLFCNGMGMAGWYKGNGNNGWGPRRTIGTVLSSPRDAVAADMDLDGDNDLLAIGYNDDRLAWYANDGAGNMNEQRTIADNMNGPTDIEVFDMDMDGDSDVVLLNLLANTVVRVRNTGGGTFAVDTMAVQAARLASGDLDGDGDADLVAGDAWYYNDGNGNFTVQQDLSWAPLRWSAMGDMDGDAQLDIVVVADVVHVLTDIAGAAYTDHATAYTALEVALADVDVDGDLDVVCAPGATGVWYENDGDGNLVATHTWTTSPPQATSTSMEVRDFNGDGAPDILWQRSSGYQHQIHYVLNNGMGAFGPVELGGGNNNYSYTTPGFADMNGDLVEDLFSANASGSICWKENLFFNAFRLRGAVFQDLDQDAVLDPADVKVPFQLVRTDANDLLLWTNANGDYDHPADTGTWHVWTTTPPLFQVVNNPDTLTATLTAQDPIAAGLDVGWVPAQQDTNGFISLTTTPTFENCNWAGAVVWLTLQNTGTFIPEDLVVQLEVDTSLMVSSVSMPPDSVVGHTYYWHVDSLGWFQSWAVALQVTTGVGGTTNIIAASALLSTMPAISVSTSVGGTIGCAFDPNDKLVTPAGYGPAHAVDISTEWLEYTIRFQNTGTDTAFTVVLRDTLDADLQWESLQVLGASHALTSISVDANGEALFEFEQIMLPDSNVNEPGSHGFINYRMRPVAGVPHGTAIHNTAAIYFDLNEPVITNTVLNTLVDCGMYFAAATDTGGGALVASEGDHHQWYYNGAPLPGDTLPALQATANGDYAVQVTNAFGCVVLSSTVTVIGMGVPTAATSNLHVVPNPAREQIILNTATALTAQHRVLLLDAQGREVHNAHGNGTTRTVLLRNGLASGVYTLHVQGPAVVGQVRVVLE